MRILHLVAGNMFGGVERLVTVLVEPSLQPQFGTESLQEQSMQPHVAVFFEGSLSDELRGMGIEPLMIGGARISRPWTLWAVRRRLDAVMSRLRPDVVVMHGCWPHVIGASIARRHGTALVFWTHQIMRGRHWLERLTGRVKPDLAIYSSEEVRLGIAPVFGSVDTALLRCPVKAPPPMDRALARSQIRQALGTAEDDCVIVMPCRFDRYKGHQALLDALGILLRRNIPGNWRCWIAGAPYGSAEERYVHELEGQVATLGLTERVKFLGHRRDIPQLLAAADLFCQPNVGAEPFGIAFVEAMGMGVPVVTSALGGALEIVDETCGLLLPPGDVNALADGLDGLIRDEAGRRRLGEGGPARAAKLCDPGDRMRDLERILKSLIHANTGTPEAETLANRDPWGATP